MVFNAFTKMLSSYEGTNNYQQMNLKTKLYLFHQYTVLRLLLCVPCMAKVGG